MDPYLTLIIGVSTLGGVIVTLAIAGVRKLGIKRGWSKNRLMATLGIITLLGLYGFMIPALLFVDNVMSMINQDPVTTIDLPELEETEYRPWIDEFTDADEHCLALNIYFEARGEEDIRGKYAVADVVMYRYMHADYPDTVCGVVEDGHYYEWRPDLPVKHMCQFSWFCDGKSDRPVNFDAFEEAIGIAKEVLHDSNYKPRVGYSLFYHATNVKPRWAKKMKFVETIGNHSFYTKNRGHVVPQQ